MAVRDVILISSLVFMVGLGFFVINFSANKIITDLVSIPAINETSEAVEAFQGTSTAVDRLDYVVFGMFVGLILALIITGWYVGGNPLFMFVFFLVIVIGVILSMVLANAWSNITSASVFQTILPTFSATAKFPITNNIMTYLPIYTIVIGLLATVVMFSKPFVTRDL